MKFNSLSISNLRAIRRFEISDLGSFVVIAGQNGCGKSCVFDAIRLLKSVYGGYSPNEYHQWFGEFDINLQDKHAIRKLFRNPDEPIRIQATLSFDEAETTFMRENAETLVQPIAWQEVTGQPVDFWTFNRMAVATQLRQFQPALSAAITRLSADVKEALVDPLHTIALEISPNGEMLTAVCKPAEVAFQAYEPQHLGVIEYHSSSRTYSRQQVGGINLDARAFEDQRRQQRLYNWQNKFQNVKAELATSYLRRMIAKESGEGGVPGGMPESLDTLNETLQELFQTFFPDKSYEGVRPQPEGALEFPVRLSSGEVHDIDELSSGEKEILYGYLKLKNSTPRGSVILLDEPELHLNPSLLQGLADFYYRHLGVSQGNQLWLVTHSDTLLRQAVGNSNYRVYQMLLATAAGPTDNQAVEVLADDDVERVTIELVGDLAAYRPHGKVVILEGDSETGFDVNVVRRLFPQFARRVNLVSGGNRQRVRDLYAAMRDAVSQAGLKNRFFAVVDRDTHPQLAGDAGASEFTWDVYHIENYLLEPDSIRAATTSLLGYDPFQSEDEVLDALRTSAAGVVDGLVLEMLQAEVNGMLIEQIRVGGPPHTNDPAADLLPSIRSSLGRLQTLGSALSHEELTRRSEGHRANLLGALEKGDWRSEFPGRSILSRYAHEQFSGKIPALIFSNAVLDKMVERGVKPEGMKTVLDRIAEQ